MVEGDLSKKPTDFIKIDDGILSGAGYVQSGVSKFNSVVRDFSGELHKKSVSLGELSQGDGTPLEISHEHVQRATAIIISSGLRSKTGPWVITGQVVEHIGAAAMGLGAGYLEKTWGIITLVVGAVVTTVLLVVRLTRKENG